MSRTPKLAILLGFSVSLALLALGLSQSAAVATKPVHPSFAKHIAVEHETPTEIWPSDADGVFSILANDMELDGDLDILVNYHRAGIAIFENREGEFQQIEPSIPGSPRLSNGPGVALFAGDGSMLEKIAQADQPGIYVWRYQRSWRLFVTFPNQDAEVVNLDLWATRFAKRKGLDPSRFQRTDKRVATLSLDPAKPPGVIAFGGGHVEILQREGESPLPFFLGRTLHRSEARPVILEHPDPHGVAWVQVAGTPEPDLFVSQGDNRGAVREPAVGKQNRFLPFAAGETPFIQVPAGTIPPDHGRTRRAEWVDVDNDGRYEIYLSNKNSANALLASSVDAEPTHDRAPELGIDYRRGATTTWMDVDYDSFQDLILYEAKRNLVVASNEDGNRFSTPPAWESRLRKEEPDNAPSWSQILRLLDYDNDGLMDVWVGTSGVSNYVFRGTGKELVAMGAVPSPPSQGERQDILVFDANNDGWVDAFRVSEDPILYLNDAGERFEVVPSASIFESPLTGVLAGSVADMNDDGWLDLLLATADEWVVMLNRGGAEDRSLRVDLKSGPQAPVGALVKIHYSDGRSQVQRYGSNRSSGSSQVAGSLHYGRGETVHFTCVEVLWPGSTDWTQYQVPAKGGTLALSAQDPKPSAPACRP